MNSAKSKSCIDCLHCKVSAQSTAGNRMCFCAKEDRKVRFREPLWREKTICKAFVYMGKRITIPLARKPLLKGVDLFCGGLRYER